MIKDVEEPKIKNEKIIENGQENKITLKENIKLNLLKIKQKKKSIEKKNLKSFDKSINIEKNNNIFENENKKNNNSIKKIHINFHTIIHNTNY